MRQSSLGAGPILSPSLTAFATCIAGGPKAVASRTPAQASGGCGGAKRSGPTGGRAYGMPRKTATPSSTAPRSRPDVVGTVVMVVDIADTSRGL